ARRELATASEEAAFDKIRTEPLVGDSYLTYTRASRTPAAEVYQDIWPARAMVTRLLQQQQGNARAAGTEAGAKLDELRGVRRRLDQLLQDPRMSKDARDRLLVEYSDRRDRLERELVARIPALNHWQEFDKLGPTDLAAVLPPRAVFIDVIRYTHFDFVD